MPITIKAKPAAKRVLNIRKKPPVQTSASQPDKKRLTFGGKNGGGFDRARQYIKEARRKKEKYDMPFRYRIPVGESGRVIIVDAAGMDELWFMHEHNWKGPRGKFDQFEVCIKDEGVCPLCQKLNMEGRYVLMLTCIDLRPYTTREGKEVKRSKKLFPVTVSMMPKFERLFKKYGTFRGLMLKMTRDNEKSAAIGDDIDVIKQLSEADLAKYGDLANPVDYEKYFKRMTEAQMRSAYGGAAAAGSSEFDDKEHEEDLDDAEMD